MVLNQLPPTWVVTQFMSRDDQRIKVGLHVGDPDALGNHPQIDVKVQQTRAQSGEFADVAIKVDADNVPLNRQDWVPHECQMKTVRASWGEEPHPLEGKTRASSRGLSVPRNGGV
jgi:hypothetical protein